MKKVLIITYYWPPSGGAGVQRWLKFVKYLREFGWEPLVYTPENPESPETDGSLFGDIPENLTVLKTRIWEPYLAYKRFMGRGKEEKIKAAFLNEKKSNRFTEDISVWIRGNFFIPDARKFWITPSAKFLRNYLENHPVDLIVSTGPPHSMHRIGRLVAARHNLPWIADFRDPWTNIDFYHDLKLTRWADFKHHRMEMEVLRDASAVIAVGRTMAEEFKQIWTRNYEVITNGYDKDDMIPSEGVVLDRKFSIAHIGSLVSSRNPKVLWEALKVVIETTPGFRDDLQIKLAGRVDITVTESLAQHGLSDFVAKTEYLPHSDVARVQQQSQVLLLLINNSPNAKSILTGKFFEYLASKRPILAIGPVNGDAAEILNETSSGLISGFTDVEAAIENITKFYRSYKDGNLISSGTNIEKYSRKNLTLSLSRIMNGLVKF